MSDYTAEQKEAMRRYKQPFIDELNRRDIIQALGLQKAARGGYICPCCGSGNGGHKTGAQVTRDHKRITCFANVNCALNGNGQGQDVYGALQAVTGKSGNEVLSEQFTNYDIREALQGAEKATEPRKAPQGAEVPPTQEKLAESPTETDKLDFRTYYKSCKEHITDDAARRYLAFRGISAETAARYYLGYDPATGYLIVPVSRSFYIARSTDPAARIRYKNPTGVSVELFNTKALQNDTGRPVFVTEGAINALSIIEAGGEAVALNSASNARKLIEHLKDHKTRSTLIICMDNDDAGAKAAAQLAEGLQELNIPFIGADVTGDHNDANEALTADRAAFIDLVGAAERSTSKPDNTADYINKRMAADIQQFRRDAERKTGFKNLDDVAGGIYAGLYSVGGISSVGKTTFISQLVEQMAEQGQHVLFFSMEQSRLEIVSKSIARRTARKDAGTAVTSLSIRKGYLPKNALDAADEYVKAVGDRLSVIEGNFSCTVGYIREYVTAYKEKNGVRPIVVIDYLQTLKADVDPQTGRKPTDTRQIVESNVTELKRMSRSLEIPVFVISSVNRSNYLAPIDFEAFKESGGIEFTSDVVWGLQLDAINDELFNKEGKIKEKREKIRDAKAAIPRSIQLVCLKNRYGVSSYTAQFTYYPQYDYFVEA